MIYNDLFVRAQSRASKFQTLNAQTLLIHSGRNRFTATPKRGAIYHGGGGDGDGDKQSNSNSRHSTATTSRVSELIVRPTAPPLQSITLAQQTFVSANNSIENTKHDGTLVPVTSGLHSRRAASHKRRAILPTLGIDPVGFFDVAVIKIIEKRPTGVLS